MARYPLNQPVRVSTTVRDLTGALVNAGTLTLVVKLAQADGTLLTTGTYATPVNDSTGTYHVDIPVTDLASIGHYSYAWTSTGTGAGVAYGDFDIFDPFETSVLPLQDARDMLNISASVTKWDAEILGWIASIEAGLERFTGGPLVNRSVTERAEMMTGQTVITVRQRPLVSVTQILSASGGVIDISGGLDLDANAGTVRRKLGFPFYGPFFVWLPQVTITYVAGWGTAVPAPFNSFARIVVQHLWESRRGATVNLLGGEETATLPGFGFAIPNRALELLNGSMNGMPLAVEAYV